MLFPWIFWIISTRLLLTNVFRRFIMWFHSLLCWSCHGNFQDHSLLSLEISMCSWIVTFWVVQIFLFSLRTRCCQCRIVKKDFTILDGMLFSTCFQDVHINIPSILSVLHIHFHLYQVDTFRNLPYYHQACPLQTRTTSILAKRTVTSVGTRQIT